MAAQRRIDLVLDSVAHDWRELSHLYPPRTLRIGGPDEEALARWRDGFFFGKCVVRNGPGFVQVRDWRWSRPRFLTFAAGRQVDLMHRLLNDAVPVDAAEEHVGELADLRLVQRIGDRLWMPAYRIWRWPMPAEFV